MRPPFWRPGFIIPADAKLASGMKDPSRSRYPLKILVTGAAGYIGSVLADDLLAHGHAVTAVDSFSRGKTSLLPCCRHPSFKFLPGDVRDASLMRSLLKDADAIIALAALVSPQSCVGKAEEARDINVRSIRMLNDLRFHPPSRCSS